MISQEVRPVRWSVDVLDVAQVPSEIGRAALSITSSEASNGSQHVIKWSLCWCECKWTQVSAVFFLNSVFCACINNKASLLINLKCPPICARLLRACPTVSEHRVDYCVQLCSSRQSEMQPESHSRGKKTTGYMSESVWLLSLEINTIYETKCKTKWQKMTATLKPGGEMMKRQTAFICRKTSAIENSC